MNNGNHAIIGPALDYQSDSWLYRQCGEAWGDHKALLRCKSHKRRKAKWASFSEESQILIRQAVKRSKGNG